MSTSDHLSDKPHEAAELFACSLYVPRKKICNVDDLRRWLCKKKQTQYDNFPYKRLLLLLLLRGLNTRYVIHRLSGVHIIRL